MTTEQSIYMALADIAWEMEIDGDPCVQAALAEERESLERQLLED